MAVQRNISLPFEEVFPAGAYVLDDIAPVQDYNVAVTGAERMQKVDEKTGLPMWQVSVLDADPDAKKSQKTINVKILSASPPVLPVAKDGLPFAAVEFDGITVTPYINTNGNRPTLEYSIKATGVKAASKLPSIPSKSE